jgi:hypothetical protein
MKAVVTLLISLSLAGCSAIRLAVPPQCQDLPIDQVYDCLNKK